jgi:hypothetical protein
MHPTLMERLPVKDAKRHKPTLRELGDLIDHFGGNLHAIARHTDYGVRQVNNWIKNAPDALKLHLLERLGAARATERRAIILRDDLPAFVIPRDLKHLVHLYLHRPWHELLELEIDEVLDDADESLDTPRTLRKKLTWDELRDAINDLDAGFAHTFRRFDLATGELLAERAEMIGGPSCIAGQTIPGWHHHALMSWVGLNAESPLWDFHEDLPAVVLPDDQGLLHPANDLLEQTIRLLIQRLEQYL